MGTAGISRHFTRWDRKRSLGALVALLTLCAACVPAPPPLPTQSCISAAPTTVTDYQRLFDVRATEAAAADIWSPTPIGARVAWFLGDTLVGRQKPPGTLQAGYKSVHNAVQVQS